MSEEEKERKANTQNCFLDLHAHELCKKAKEALEKANNLLSESGKTQDRVKQGNGEKKP